MMDNNRENLFHCITATSFVMDDLRLFLDTHPTDQDALQHWDHVQKVRTEAVEEYSRHYGPISMYQVDSCNEWTWINGPWPWEGRC